MVFDRTALWISIGYLLCGLGWVFLSEHLTLALFPDLAPFLRIAHWKGGSFVVATAAILYLATRRQGWISLRARQIGSLRMPILAAAALASALLAVGLGTLAYAVNGERDNAREQLRVITDLKLAQISKWLGEHHLHGELLLKTPLLDNVGRRSDAERRQLAEWLRAFGDAEGYRNILVVDAAGEALLTAGAAAPIQPTLQETVRWAIASGETLTTDLYRTGEGADAPIVMDLVMPLPAQPGERRQAVVLRADAVDFLFPFVQSWPTASPSAETLLLRRDGDQLVYLNELRHRPGSALGLRIPISREELVGVQAVLGRITPGQLVEGLDYRGVEVVGMVRAVLGTPWIMVAKVDRSELFALAVRTAELVTLVVALVLLLVAGTVVLLYQRRELRFAQLQREIRDEKMQALQLVDSLADSSADAIYAKDTAGRYLLYNRTAREVTGMAAEEVIGKTDRELFPSGEAAALIAIDHQVMAEDRIHQQEELLTTTAGMATFQTIKGPLHDAAGKVIGIFGISRNITKERQAEQELRESAALLALFVEHAPVALAMFDREMRYVHVSRRWREDYGLGTADLQGVCHYDLFPDLPERWKEVHRRGLAGEVLHADADRHDRADGSPRWLHWEILPWHSRPGEVGGIVIFAEDITTRVIATEALEEARTEAELANAAKTRFLAAASHDLRQPMQGLRLLLELAFRKAGDTAAILELCERMNDALVSSEKMLSRLMEFAALESGKVAVQREPLRLDELLRRVVREHAGEAAAKGLRLRCRAFPCATDSDPVLLERIVRNLVINAIRYTDRGGVLVAVRPRGEALRVEVRDTGVGIAEDMQQVIFEEFRQLANPERDRSKGSGLGLAIVARTARLLGHRLSLRSFEHRGSVFTLEVPALAVHDQGAAAAPAPRASAAPATILVVEDDAMQATALQMLLAELGHTVEMAADANSAVAIVEGMATPPALVLSDFRLPGRVSGIELITRLRGILDRSVPAILITGDIQQGIADAAAAAHCQLLHKPYGVPELLALIEQELDTTNREPA